MIDPESKVSGYSSIHVSTRAFMTLQELSRLKATWQADPGFKEFVDQKSLYSAKEQECP